MGLFVVRVAFSAWDERMSWPPVAAEGNVSGDYSVVTRDDGAKQLAYKGKPLYLWVKDTKPGDKTGDGFNNVWHVAKP